MRARGLSALQLIRGLQAAAKAAWLPPIALAGLLAPLLMTELGSRLGTAHAEQLPIKSYSTTDGLPRNSINCILPDSHGFIWICTTEGISRFGGYRFVSFGMQLNPRQRMVRDMIETANHEYWLATSAGLIRFDPLGEKTGDSARMFVIHRLPDTASSPIVTDLHEDRNGNLWVGAATGLYRLQRGSPDGARLEPTPLADPRSNRYHVRSLLVDLQGVAWIGLSGGEVARLLPDGRVEHFGKANGMPDLEVSRLFLDQTGQVWAGTGRGLIRFVSSPVPDRPVVKRMLTRADGLPGAWIRDIWQGQDGSFWLATDRGLAILRHAGNDTEVTGYTIENGLSDYYLKCLVGDRQGNIWIGTANAGAMKLARNGFTTFGYNDGLASAVSLFTDNDGQMLFAGYALTSRLKGVKVSPDTPLYQWRLGRFDRGQLNWILPNLPPTAWYTVGWNQTILRDSRGDWWVPTQRGVFRYASNVPFEGLGRARPKQVYDLRSGLGGEDIIRLFEDSHGNIWIVSTSSSVSSLDRWNRDTERIDHILPREGATWLGNRQVAALGEDRSGSIWLGLSNSLSSGGVARLRPDGRFDYYGDDGQYLKGNVLDLLTDSAGRLWIASTVGGVILVEDPSAENPDFKFNPFNAGLRSNRVTSLGEDLNGRIYIGAARGVEQLDPATGHLHDLTHDEGLALGSIDDIERDGKGDLWFATSLGISRYTPQPPVRPEPPTILIDSIRVRGTRINLSALGETSVNLPVLRIADDPIEIDYLGLSPVPGENLRYETRLTPVDGSWQDRGTQRTINYANIAPGGYRFEVRAIDRSGTVSTVPAIVSFTVKPPFWLRWWFFLAVGGTLFAFGGYIQWLRTRQTLRLERMRTRISNDLHDDVGASLSQITILSEVVRRRLGRLAQTLPPEEDASLEKIAATSREAVDALNEIVWVVNPSRDRLTDLVQRMRRFASDTLSARDIVLRFTAPEANLQIELDLRRQIFLIFKEIINNIVRHSHASLVEVDLSVSGQSLVLVVSDNGRGLPASPASDSLSPSSGGQSGQGIDGMKQRAIAIGASLSLTSSPLSGTIVALTLPIRRRGLFYYLNR